MKKTVSLLMILVLPLIFLNCGPTKVGPKLKQSRKHIVLTVDPAVITTDAQLEDSIRIKFGRSPDSKIDIEHCYCGDDSLRLVTFGHPIRDFKLHTKLNSLNNDDDDGVEGDLQYISKLPRKPKKRHSIFKVKTVPDLDLSDFFSDDTSKTVIAIMDSGIDLDHHFKDKKILYPNPVDLNCGELSVGSGWNFVKDTSDIQDDYRRVGHGTLVAKILAKKLENDTVGYQLLPIKIANKKGKVRYWDVICAMSYIKQIQQNTGNKIKVVNSSFGMGLHANSVGQMHLLEEYIKDISDGALVVASAGNKGIDTDGNMRSTHIPSGYPLDNILAVGGHSITQGQLVRHPDSNYGKESIDIAAPYTYDIENIKTQEYHTAPGTSFGTAYVSAFIAKLFAEDQNMDPKTAKAAFLSYADTLESLKREFKDGKYVE